MQEKEYIFAFILCVYLKQLGVSLHVEHYFGKMKCCSPKNIAT